MKRTRLKQARKMAWWFEDGDIMPEWFIRLYNSVVRS